MTVTVGLLLLGVAFAQEGGPPPVILQEAPESPKRDPMFDRDAKGWGIGIILGIPTGLSAAYRPGDRVYYDMAAAWSFDTGTFQTHVDALLTVVDLRTDEIPDVHFPLYLGVGPRLRLGDSPYLTGHDIVDLGVRVPVGMSFIHDQVPLEAFIELAPGIGLYPSTRGIIDVAIGGRFYLP